MKNSQRIKRRSADPHKGSVLNHFLKKFFGFKSFKTTTQRRAVVEILKGESDVTVSMSAGSGRSLCYQLPILISLHKAAIIFMPRLLRIQEHASRLLQQNILYNYVHVLSYETTDQEKMSINNQLSHSRTQVKGLENHFLYVTIDQASTSFFLELLSKLVHDGSLSYIVLDESYSDHDWDAELTPQYKKLSEIRDAYSEIPWVVTSVAASPLENNFKTSKLL